MEAHGRLVHGIGVVAAWIAIPCQIIVAVACIVGCQFFLLSATRMQETEWRFFVAFVILEFGWIVAFMPLLLSGYPVALVPTAVALLHEQVGGVADMIEPAPRGIASSRPTEAGA